MSSHKNRHTHWSYCLTATNEPWGGLWRNLETVESLKMWNISFKPEQHLLILTVKTQIIKIFLSESRCKNHRPCQNLHTWMDRFFSMFFLYSKTEIFSKLCQVQRRLMALICISREKLCWKIRWMSHGQRQQCGGK